MADRQFDVVVLGATGFTGRLVVEYMYRTYGTGGELSWAVAGRNTGKLDQILREVAEGAEIPALVVDTADEASVREMVGATKVVCTTVGPYALYGSSIVAACAELGTHYCDLTGEVQWMRKMIDEHHATAEKSGARIVHTCGFDSIPSDMGVFFVQQQMQEQHGNFADKVKYRVVKSAGGVSGGTVASMQNMMEESKEDPSLLDLIADPYALNPANMPRGEDGADQTGAEYDEDFHQWTGPFVMAGINTRVVRRSHALLGYPWGDQFSYDEAVLMGDGPGGYIKALLMAVGTGLMMAAASFGPTKALFDRVAPSPGEGPSPEAIANGFFEIEVLGSNGDNTLIAVVTGDRDPGYGATSKMLAESAVCLAKDDLDGPAGILTPSVAMGNSLLVRLADNAGMTFNIKD